MRFHSLVIFTLVSGVVHAGLLQKGLKEGPDILAIIPQANERHPSQFQLPSIADPNPAAKYDREGSPSDSPDGSHLHISRMRGPRLNRHNRVQSIPQHHPTCSQLNTRHTPPNGQQHRSSHPPPPKPAQNPLSDTDKARYIIQLEGAIKEHIIEVLKLEVAKDQCTADLEKGQEEKEQQLDYLAAIEAVERMLSSSKKALREAESELKAVMS
ncbi:hypothetical protein BSLG_009721 [Batrachochytrium salamandrivorans]|nr:hypothetical protein BASA81_015087 [Batrachochytrium salamandrivorans]KAH9277402.1 hypothetical protein BASA83_000272 [Batrachochytrium salamandrivorans]KAJ1330137.1 hypothetical protein BSLG_009721 [Batrachochytrium salamandrivorans]